jgi:hypothetical protein
MRNNNPLELENAWFKEADGSLVLTYSKKNYSLPKKYKQSLDENILHLHSIVAASRSFMASLTAD